MRPEGYGHDASSWLGLARQVDEFDMSAMKSVEVADHYNSRRNHPSDPPGLPLWRPQTVKQRADRGRIIQTTQLRPKDTPTKVNYGRLLQHAQTLILGGTVSRLTKAVLGGLAGS